MTFKDLRKIIAEKNKELVTESKFYDPKLFLERQKDQWFQIKENYTPKAEF